MSDEAIAGRIVSVPAPERPSVDDVLVTDGAYISGDTPHQVLLEKNFATHHDLSVGNSVRVVTPSGPWEGKVIGIAISPEYLWPARSVPEHMPDVMRRWGVLYLDYGTIASATGFNGSINEVAVTFSPGADRTATIDRVKAILTPYGVTSVVPREEQPSKVILDTLVGALDSLALVFPLFFLLVAALCTYVLLSRLVNSQRMQVGVLLALGYSRRRVLTHYLGFALVTGLAGSLAGILAGYLMAFPVTDMFARQVTLPLTLKVPHWDVMAAGVALSVLFASLAGVIPAFRASKQEPAETMRGESPGTTIGFARRTSALGQNARVLRKLPVRYLARHPLRSTFTVVSIALAGSLVIVPFGFLDSMDGATQSYHESMNFDLQVLLYRPLPANVSEEAASLDGVAGAESFIAAQTSMVGEVSSYGIALYGLRAESESMRLFSSTGERVRPTESGILLSALFQKRGMHVGERVNVSGIITQVAGFTQDSSINGYLQLGTVQESLRMNGSVNGLFIRLAPNFTEDAVRARLYSTFPVWAVSSVARSLQDWNDMLRLYYAFIGLVVVFGVALAGAIGFNAVTINVLERTREIATMQTLGIRPRSIAGIVTTENLILLSAGIFFGSFLGNLLTGYLVSFFGGNAFDLDPAVSARTFVLSAFMLLGVLLASEVPSLRQALRMNLARMTKERVG